jgi:hypothetical protein
MLMLDLYSGVEMKREKYHGDIWLKKRRSSASRLNNILAWTRK